MRAHVSGRRRRLASALVLLPISLGACSRSLPPIQAPVVASNLDPQGRPCGQPFRFTGRRITVATTRVGALPFVRGSVDGVSGRFMLDTGSTRALALDETHLRRASDPAASAPGFTGGGQRFRWSVVPCVARVDVPGAGSWRAVSGAESADFGFVARDVGADFLGFIGYPAVAGYVLRTDYRHSRMSFFRGDAGRGLAAALRGRRVLARKPLKSRALPGSPTFETRLDGVTLVASIDTGQAGTIFISDEQRERLLRAHVLEPADMHDGERRYRVNGLELADGLRIDLPAVDLSSPDSPVLRVHGITEDAALTLGATLFDQLDVVCDYAGGNLYLLAPR